MAMNRRIGLGGGQLRHCLGCLLLLGVLLLCAGAVRAPVAWADGDPGSDVLVNQSVFLPADADVGVAQQTQLDGLLSRAQSAGFPVRVAVIAHRDDLGAVTPLWLEPQSYARFLDIELSLVFKGPLLVVMPNGLGFQWPGHAAATAERRLESIKVAAGASGLVAATTTAVKQLSAVNGARLPGASAAATPDARASAGGAATTAGGAASAAPGGPRILSPGGGATSASLIVGIMAALIAIGVAVWLITRRVVHHVAGRTSTRSAGLGRLSRPAGGWSAPLWRLLSLAGVVAVGAVAVHLVSVHASSSHPVSDLATSATLDPGTSLPGAPAPNFTLYDQFGKRVTVRQYRGKVIVLAFIDSECTTLCPLTTTAMLDAKRLLGAAGTAGAAAWRRRGSEGDADRGCAQLLPAARPHSRVAVRYGHVGAARSRVEALLRGDRHPRWADLAYCGAVRDRSTGARAKAVHDRAVIYRGASARPTAGPRGIAAASQPPRRRQPPVLRPGANRPSDGQG